MEVWIDSKGNVAYLNIRTCLISWLGLQGRQYKSNNNARKWLVKNKYKLITIFK